MLVIGIQKMGSSGTSVQIFFVYYYFYYTSVCITWPHDGLAMLSSVCNAKHLFDAVQQFIVHSSLPLTISLTSGLHGWA